MFARKLVLMFGLLAVLGISLMQATPSQASLIAPQEPGNKIPVAMLLRQDGTLDLQKGITGTLDMAGWNVRLDPQAGPVLVKQSSTSSNWSGMQNGFDGGVNAIAVDGNKVYVGGYFTHICGNNACNANNLSMNRIALWDGNSWSGVGHGVDGTVYTIAIHKGALVVGGEFQDVCASDACLAFNKRVNHIALWNGTTWSTLGYGVNNWVTAIAFGSGVGSPIFAGGGFNFACGNITCDQNNITVNFVASYGLGTWIPLGSGLDGSVFALETNNGVLYAGGNFDKICQTSACATGTTTHRLSQWNGSAWSPVAYGVDEQVNTILFIGKNLYVGGNFRYACGNTACNYRNVALNYLGSWDGSEWHSIGNGVSNFVYTLATDGVDLFAGGIFSSVCADKVCQNGNMQVNYLAKWDGTNWFGVENGTSNQVSALTLKGNDLIGGGFFQEVCGNTDCSSANLRVNYVAHYSSAAGCSTKPSTPTLVAPANNTQLSTVKVTLDWSDASCASQYKVTVKQNAKNGVTLFKQTVSTSQVKTSVLPKGHTYFWRVKACNNKGCAKSAWSAFIIKQ